MRILVLQLARFGDIYQTWPALKALQRSYPESELHVLVRESFKAALEGFDGVHLHALPVQEIFAPLFDKSDEETALARLNQFLQPLVEARFNKIINLSFSPASSYVSDILSHKDCEVRGYTRFSDGYLDITDDTSAYFFAQGEIGKFNRFHITQIFASVAGVELTAEDYRALAQKPCVKDQVVVHLGASQAERVYPGELWVEALSELIRQSSSEILLVGGKAEAALARTVIDKLGSTRVRSYAGQTTFSELMLLIASAKLFVGCDSGPAQIASITQTPVLQLTSDASNFWTTGPTSTGSRILYAPELSQIPASRLADEAVRMLKGRPAGGPCILRSSQTGDYSLHDISFDHFAWELIQALYTNTAYPDTDAELHLLAFQRIFELSELGLNQLNRWHEETYRKTATLVLANIDELLAQVAEQDPHVAPLIHWFETEKLRIPPGTPEATFERTQKLFADLHLIASVYYRYGDTKSESLRASELARKISPHFREFRLNIVQEDFQRLISTLQELSRHSTKVGGSEWHSLLNGLNEALERKDLIEVADQLEYVIVPALSS
jgi:ADP-heptose:LPS heptosyltransferase